MLVYFQLNSAKKNKKWFTFWNTAFYSPTTYSFQLPGILLSHFITNRIFFIVYSGRLSAFLISLLMLFFAIKKIPVKQKTFFMLALMPMFLQEATSLAGDALVNAVTFTSIALALFYSFSAVYKLNWKQLSVVVILSILIICSKIVYIPVILIFLLITVIKFKSRKQYVIFFSALFAACMLLNIVWSLFVKQYLEIIPQLWVSAGIDPSEQTKYILTHPFNYLVVIFKTYATNGLDLFIEIFGWRLGWGNTYVNKFILIIYSLCTLLVALSEKYCVRFKYRMLFFISAFAIILLISFCLYIQNTPVLAEIINFGGRYFIPVVALLAISINCKKICINEDLLFRYLLPVVSLTHLFAFSAIVSGLWNKMT